MPQKHMFDFRQINTSLCIRFINLSVLDVDWLITWPIDMLSTRNKRSEFSNWLYHKMRATTCTTGKLPKKVRSISIDFLLLFSKCIKGLSCSLIWLFNKFSGRTIQQALKQYLSPLLSYFHFLVSLVNSYLELLLI